MRKVREVQSVKMVNMKTGEVVMEFKSTPEQAGVSLRKLVDRQVDKKEKRG